MIPELFLGVLRKKREDCLLVHRLLQDHPGLYHVDVAISKEARRQLSCTERAQLLADMWALLERAR
jgi:hypothetical protein